MAGCFRKELKYIISEEAYMRMQGLLAGVMEPDEHGDNGGYMVRSQYYDSISDADLRDNLDGVYEKRKIRVRIYSPDGAGGKLEYKCKSGTDGIKYSISLTREEIMSMENHKYDFLLGREEPLATKLYTKMTEEVYSPKTIIEYDRIAYTYPVSDVRITFDRNIRCTVNPYGIFEKEPLYTPILAYGMGVLEVKYNDFFPEPLKPLISSLENVAESYSKYSNSRLSYI